MKTRFLFSLVMLFVCVPAFAFAHPGHGNTDPDSWRHYLTEPVHVVVASAVLVGTVVLVRGWAARRKARKLLSTTSCER